MTEIDLEIPITSVNGPVSWDDARPRFHLHRIGRIQLDLFLLRFERRNEAPINYRVLFAVVSPFNFEKLANYNNFGRFLPPPPLLRRVLGLTT